jgi:hypothetical protein
VSNNNVIDLAKHRVKKSDDPSFEELSLEEQEKIRIVAEKAGITTDSAQPPVMEVTTAFLVFITTDGQVVAHNDISLPIKPQRLVGMDDMYGAVSNIKRDIEAQSAAGATLNLQQQVMTQMAQQQEATRLQQHLGPDLKNPFPNGPRNKKR